MTRKRYGFLADAFHQAAVAHKDIGEMVDQRIAEGRVHDPLRERHSYRLRDTLAERPGRQFNAVGMTILRVSRRFAANLPEALQLLDGHVAITCETQQAVEQHLAVPIRQDKAV